MIRLDYSKIQKVYSSGTLEQQQKLTTVFVSWVTDVLASFHMLIASFSIFSRNNHFLDNLSLCESSLCINKHPKPPTRDPTKNDGICIVVDVDGDGGVLVEKEESFV